MVRKGLDHPLFQRLRHIKQAYEVTPGKETLAKNNVETFRDKNNLGWRIECIKPKLKVYKDSEDPIYIQDPENSFYKLESISKIIDYITNKIEGSSYIFVDVNKKNNKKIKKFISKLKKENIIR